MLMLGDQTVRPRYWAELAVGGALLDVLGAELGGDGVGDPWTIGASQVAAMPIACGNTVASPARATPCRPSFHQL
jgi:hypothetical protein